MSELLRITVAIGSSPGAIPVMLLRTSQQILIINIPIVPRPEGHTQSEAGRQRGPLPGLEIEQLDLRSSRAGSREVTLVGRPGSPRERFRSGQEPAGPCLPVHHIKPLLPLHPTGQVATKNEPFSLTLAHAGGGVGLRPECQETVSHLGAVLRMY